MTTMGTDDVPIETVALVAQLVQHSADMVHHTSSQLMEGFMAERDATRHLLGKALDDLPRYPTTAEWEGFRERCYGALTPSQSVMTRMHDRARRWVAGERLDEIDDGYGPYGGMR